MMQKKGQGHLGRGWTAGRAVVLATVFVFGALTAPGAAAQVEAPMLYLKRGQLWSSFFYSKSGAPFSNWARIDSGLDWPGFRPELIGADIGGTATHLVTGGIWFSSRDSEGKVIAMDDFAMYSFSTNPEPESKYRVTRHENVFRGGANHWGATDPGAAEDLIVSEWERNPQWQPQWLGDRQHPISVRREVRQWGGFEREQNYILIEYTITNDSDSTLFDAYAMISYAFTLNSRSWRILFPGETEGSRNVRFVFSPAQRRLFGWTENSPEVPTRDERYGRYPEGGPDGRGEYLAPAYVGLQLLSVSPNRNGQANHINGWAFMPANPQQDQQGPLVNRTGFDQQFEVLRNPLSAENATIDHGDAMWQRSRVWSLISLGPWDLAPGESVRIAYAEVVGGADYKDVIARRTQSGSWEMPPAGEVASAGNQAFVRNSMRALAAFQSGYNVPKPPPAPPFSVALFDDPQQIGNLVTWDDRFDSHRDPDYTGAEAEDLAGYRLYRSHYLPIGPWERIHDIPKQDPRFFDASTGTYTVLDTVVTQGFSYYYALTAYDTGHDTWPPDPSARFPETGNSNRVPPLESSLFANRTDMAFKATIPAAQTLDDVIVVPNPFVARSGFVNPGDTDVIQFTNIPSPSTIRIYTISGNLVRTIDHDDGSGIAFWDQATSYGQWVKSGVYIFHVETPEGLMTTGRFAIIR
jgi:hypothetical protein